MDLAQLLKFAVERKASDLHLKVGTPPILRIDDRLVAIPEQPRLTQEAAMAIASAILSPKQLERFKEKSEVDLAYSVPNLGRFRVNVFQQRGMVGIVLRVIPIRIQTIPELNLPPVLEKLALEPRGLILVTGTTGSGKSSTLAAMIDHINANRSVHVLTIEDPIEFLHRDKRSLVNQREVGADTTSFGEALRSALRQDPDVILVGEMRDYETISTALIAAETGHLVLSTLHTLDATETVNRIISVFPPFQQKQIRLQLAAVLRGIVSQRLIPKADGKGRVPAVEVCVATGMVRECIIDSDKTRTLADVIAAGMTQYGMQTFDQSLMTLYRKGLIAFEEALLWCSNPDDFVLKVRGIESAADSTWQASGQDEPPAQIPGMTRF
jgi:twitching motility protein PilT